MWNILLCDWWVCGVWVVLFNLYGPRAQSDDTERIQFKLMFYKILQVIGLVSTRYWRFFVMWHKRLLFIFIYFALEKMGESSAAWKEVICCWWSQHCPHCYGSLRCWSRFWEGWVSFGLLSVQLLFVTLMTLWSFLIVNRNCIGSENGLDPC